MQISLISIDETLDTAFEIFHEMVEDNLEYNDILLYQSNFDEDGAAIASDAGPDWEAQVGFDVDRQVYIEIQIGLSNSLALETVFARMLISRDPQHKFCHILWKRN